MRMSIALSFHSNPVEHVVTFPAPTPKFFICHPRIVGEFPRTVGSFHMTSLGRVEFSMTS